MFDERELAEPFPEGVVQSVAAEACEPKAVPVPSSAAIEPMVAESKRSAGGLVSKVHFAMTTWAWVNVTHIEVATRMIGALRREFFEFMMVS